MERERYIEVVKRVRSKIEIQKIEGQKKGERERNKKGEGERERREGG